MITVPTSRVLTPQLVVQPNSCLPSRDLKLDSARARKVLPEKMRSAGLDRFAILHHRFDAKRLHRAGETFALRFLAGENRQREIIAHEGFVNVEHLLRLLARFGFGFVHGVAFLPEEFRRAQERCAAAFPSGRHWPIG